LENYPKHFLDWRFNIKDFTSRPTFHFTSALRAQLPKPNTPRKAPNKTKPCSWRLVEMVVSWPVDGEVKPNEVTHFTLTQKNIFFNLPSLFLMI